MVASGVRQPAWPCCPHRWWPEDACQGSCVSTEGGKEAGEGAGQGRGEGTLGPWHGCVLQQGSKSPLTCGHLQGLKLPPGIRRMLGGGTATSLLGELHWIGLPVRLTHLGSTPGSAQVLLVPEIVQQIRSPLLAGAQLLPFLLPGFGPPHAASGQLGPGPWSQARNDS